MRRAAVSPVSSCAEPLSNCRKYVAVNLLSRDTLLFAAEPKCKLSELFSAVAEQMCLQGMQDPDLFGLAVILDGEYVFVDPENKVGKYAPKAWKTSQTDGLDSSNHPLLQFSLRVKFYVECHLLLRDPVSRHHYYLQLRENVLVHRQQCQQQACFLLAAWALQADMGDYCDSGGRAYFQPADYFPSSVIAGVGVDHILASMPALHGDNRHLTAADAELAYIREASAAEAPHNLHLYRLKRRKADHTGSVLLGIYPNGIELYQEEKNNSRKLMASFVWTNISKLSFEKKKFEMSALTQKFTFYTSSDEKSRHLFYLCKAIHLFTHSLKDRLAELRQRSDEDRRSRGGSLQLSGGVRSGWEYLHKSGKSTDQRVSVISNTSSNTTSGIVSDRTVPSLDESDDDLRMEMVGLMMPAPTESVESGVDSLTRSLSQLDSASSRSPQRSPTDDQAALAPKKAAEAASAGGAQPVCPAADSHRLRHVSRTGSAHSASSQHSASTVRSRYSLAKLSHKTVDIVVDGEAAAPFAPPASSHCCSTCVEDDSTSVCSDAAGARLGRRTLARACVCSPGSVSDGASVTSGSTVYARQSGSPRSLHTATGSDSVSVLHASHDSQTSVASTTDSTRAVDNDADQSLYDYAAPDGGRHYADFYRPTGPEATAARAAVGDASDNVSVRSGASATSNTSSQADTLDYSVHSAHTSVGSVITTPGSFPRRTTVSSTFDTDSDYVQVPYDRDGRFRLAEPAGGVPMATVTTVTPVGLAQSQQTADAGEPEPRRSPEVPPPPPPPAPAAESDRNVPRIVSVPAASAAPSSEAPARFITTRPLVTVFRAHASVAVTQSARFASQPLTVAARPRAAVPSFVAAPLPAPLAVKPKPVMAAALAGRPDALLRSVSSHEPGLTVLPTIGRNNYLDVHASHPALSTREPPPHADLARQLAAGAGPGAAGCRPSVATVYINQVTRTQIEQFQRQLQSDSDYVIYPLKDPDISRQEYVDAKHCSLVAGGLPPPPPYRAPKANSHYLSSPDVAAAARSDGSPAAPMSQYLSSPNVADSLYGTSPSAATSSYQSWTGGQYQTASLYGAASTASSCPSYSSAYSLRERLDSLQRQRHHLSSHSLASSGTYGSSTGGEPAELDLLRAALLTGSRCRTGVVRAKSDDNLLSSSGAERRASPSAYMKRPPPPYWQARSQVRGATPSPSQTQSSQHSQQLSQTEEERQVQQQRQQTLQKHQQLIREHLERIHQLTPSPSQPAPSQPTADGPPTSRSQLTSDGQDSAQSHPRQSSSNSDDGLDIYGLRFTSRQMDLPLISALCNDRLLRRTASRPRTWHEADGSPRPPPQASHPAAGQPILAKHKTLGLPAFPQARRQPVTAAAGAQLSSSAAATDRRLPSTSHRHPQPSAPSAAKLAAKRDTAPAPVR